jgi:enamine deaminase RidA (YjgF/YER057c/UK114 family)
MRELGELPQAVARRFLQEHRMPAASIARYGKTDRLSRVVVHHGTAYLSGITADDKTLDTGGQTQQVLRKADELLLAAGTDKANLLFVQIWLKDIADFDEMNVAWLAWVDPDHPPARATVGSSFAHPDIRVEIQFVAAA